MRMSRKYRLAAPMQTHWGIVKCEDANCLSFQNGWTTRLLLTDREHQAYAAEIRRIRPGMYKTWEDDEGYTRFEFPPGIQCFEIHQGRLERDFLYVVKQGRQHPYIHRSAENWLDDMHSHLDKIGA